jgi:hypothetical protein
MKLCMAMAGMAVALAAVSGCRQGDMVTLSDTQGEHDNRVARSLNETVRQIPDDVDMIMLWDKPIRLSEKPVPSH